MHRWILFFQWLFDSERKLRKARQEGLVRARSGMSSRYSASPVRARSGMSSRYSASPVSYNLLRKREAEYLDDIPDLPGELYGAFVQSQRATGKIKSIDASKCLVFADEKLKYHGQAIGVVVAETRELAKAAAKLVEVSYEEGGKPILTIKEAMETGDKYHKAPDFTGSTQALEFGNVEQALKKSKHVIEGEISFGSQYHFTMEPIAARTVPTEEGYDVWCTTQWPTETQNVVATVLDIPANSVRRIGGAYGCKISRSNLVAAASAIAAHKLKKPVRIALDIETQMTLVGWREPYYSKYKVDSITKEY
ncbi:Xanthine dehydrogenase [Armadillidium vulgare]|nr:Xanthine dehydrogenase [Armadillidium vulgare]